MDPALRDAVLGATNIQSPTSPLGSFPELARLYQSSFQLPQSGGAANALANQATQTVADQKAAAAAKKKSDYQRIKKKDGGYAFFDPSGKEISAYDYANGVGKNPADVLADSENPIDIGYQQDYKNLQDYIGAKLNSKQDSQAASQAKQIEDQVRQAHGIDLSSLNPQQLIDQFKQAYPTVYGGHRPGVEAGSVLIGPRPSATSLDLTGGGAGIGG